MRAPGTAEQVQDLATLSSRAAQLWDAKVGVIDDSTGNVLSFGEIAQRSNQIAHALAELGVNRGDRVAVMLRNGADFPLTWLGIAKLGAVMVPMNVNYRAQDAAYIIRHASPKIAVCSMEFVPLLNELRANRSALEKLAVVDGDTSPGTSDLKRIADAASRDSPSSWPVSVSEDLVNIQYTSGTTGLPKGCMLSHGYWLRIARKQLLLSPKLTPEDVVLTAQPFYYMDPQWNFASALLSGASLVVLDRFHPSTFWDKIRQYGVSCFYCLGMMPTALLKTPVGSKDQQHRVRTVLCSGIPPQLHRNLEDRWGAPWHEAYGMTETGGDIWMRPDEHDALVGTGCMGRARPDREVRVVGPLDRPVPRGEIGELVLRGPGMMDGYFQDQEATNAAFRNGWFHTGDLVRMDRDGLVYYVGRKKDMIRRSGENISAAEVEETICSHSAVTAAACVPVPDELRGEEVKAYVVLRDRDMPATEIVGSLVEFCLARLAYFKVPRYWTMRDQLPTTPSERVAKTVLVSESPDLRIGAYDRIDGVWRR